MLVYIDFDDDTGSLKNAAKPVIVLFDIDIAADIDFITENLRGPVEIFEEVVGCHSTHLIGSGGYNAADGAVKQKLLDLLIDAVADHDKIVVKPKILEGVDNMIHFIRGVNGIRPEFRHKFLQNNEN